MSKQSSTRVLQIPLNLESLVWAILILAGFTLFALSVYRAATYSFTVDESVDFGILNWDQRYSQMGNLSEPYVLEMSANLFGTSELSLRLSTLFGHALYLVCSLFLLKRVRSVLLRLSGFVLFNLNPFLLDFMFLARGYGLALGCLMLSVLLLTLSYEHRDKSRFVLYLFLSVLTGCLTVVANLSFLNFIVPLLLAVAWLLFTDSTLRRIEFRHFLPAAGIYAVAGGFLAFMLLKAFDLQTRGALSYGGHTGFLNDTFGSLFSSSRYFVSYSPQINTGVLLTVFGLFGAICLINLWMLLKRPKVPLAVLYSVLLIGALVLPILENTFLGVLYPLDRATLYYIPLFALALIATFDLVANKSFPAWMRSLALVAPSLVAVALVFHFFRSYDPHIVYTWRFNTHDKQVIEIINYDRVNMPSDRPLKLGNTWLYEPSMNFYRFTRGYTWLAPVTRDPINGTDFDYIYAYQEDLNKTPIPNSVVLAKFADTNTVLLRVIRENAK